MYLNSVSNDTNFGYNLTRRFEKRFQYLPELLSELKKYGTRYTRLDYKNGNVSMDLIVVTNQNKSGKYKKYVQRVEEIRNLSPADLKALEINLVMDSLLNRAKEGLLEEIGQVFLKKFSHLKEYIENFLSNPTFKRLNKIRAHKQINTSSRLISIN